MNTNLNKNKLQLLAKTIDCLGDFVLTHLDSNGKILVIYLAKDKQPKMPILKLTLDDQNNYQLVVYPITISPAFNKDINLTEYSSLLDMIYNCVTDFSQNKHDLLNLIYVEYRNINK